MKKYFLIFLCLILSRIAIAQELEGFKTFSSLEELLDSSNLNGKPIFLEAYLPDCPHCKAFIPTFNDPKVVEYLKTINAYQLNMENSEIRSYIFSLKWNITSTPTFIFLDKDGNLIKILKAHSDINNPEELIKTIKDALDPENNPKVLLEKLNKGNYNGNDLLRLAQYSKSIADTSINNQVVNIISQKIPKENWNNVGMIKFINESMIEENNPIFYYMIHHLDQYYLKADTNSIRYIVENTINSNLFRPNNHLLSEERIQEMRFGLSAIGISDEEIKARFILVEVDKLFYQGEMEKGIMKIKEFYKGESIPEKELEFWCNKIKFFNKDIDCPL